MSLVLPPETKKLPPIKIFLPAPLLKAPSHARQKETGQKIAALCEYELRPVLHLRNPTRMQILYPKVSAFAKKTLNLFCLWFVSKLCKEISVF